MTPPAAPKFQAPAPAEEVGAHRRAAAAKASLTIKDVAAAAGQRAATLEQDAEHNLEISGFKPESTDHERKYGWVRLDELAVDPQIQRPLNVAEVNAIARGFHPAALGTLTISARVDAAGNETLVVVDGQQRRAGALQAQDLWESLGFSGKVRADVHYGLTQRDEAKLFRLLNFRRAVQPIHLFKTALVEGNPDAIAVQKILDDLGIPFGTPRGYSGAKSSVRLVARRNGATILRWALAQVQKIYDAEGKGGCYDAAVVEAFYWLYDHHGSRIDEDNLYKKLSSMGGGTSDLVGHAKTIKGMRGGHIGVNLIRAIIARYNHDKRSARTKLPDWTLDRVVEDQAPVAEEN